MIGVFTTPGLIATVMTSCYAVTELAALPHTAEPERYAALLPRVSDLLHLISVMLMLVPASLSASAAEQPSMRSPTATSCSLRPGPSY
ncbi:uncharacterized protein PHACADRAFT_260943 [Phanerochaete carnosa HHB-10118-sp]|uniref:Uncharacterized protein n=1 Tax=Phanerochaete carnosa (strain HHB-10118-sp) TaxID=650164 RepID=K5W081_PHACS|nr:uncharacterized protein PHACADRAFT_260943 [Phanerochaete carnosa HHB-10118-sp]EKM52495.1 hypothetical protein PHACADRAFT_260943 [Phanerochaete carnosa HHB-10118-sp]